MSLKPVWFMKTCKTERYYKIIEIVIIIIGRDPFINRYSIFIKCEKRMILLYEFRLRLSIINFFRFAHTVLFPDVDFARRLFPTVPPLPNICEYTPVRSRTNVSCVCLDLVKAVISIGIWEYMVVLWRDIVQRPSLTTVVDINCRDAVEYLWFN